MVNLYSEICFIKGVDFMFVFMKHMNGKSRAEHDKIPVFLFLTSEFVIPFELLSICMSQTGANHVYLNGMFYHQNLWNTSFVHFLPNFSNE